jgi:hypothetical protein
MTPAHDAGAIDAVVRLRSAIERAIAMLTAPQLDGLLASEIAIEGALTDVRRMTSVPVSARGDLRSEIERTRAALARCRRLGASLDEFARLSLEAQGRGVEYGPRRTPTRYGTPQVDTRV